MTVVIEKDLHNYPDHICLDLNKKWSIITWDFSNCSHIDRDYVKGYFDKVQTMIKDYPHIELVQYLSRFVTIPPILTKKENITAPHNVLLDSN